MDRDSLNTTILIAILVNVIFFASYSGETTTTSGENTGIVSAVSQQQKNDKKYTEILNALQENYGIDENTTLGEMQTAFKNYFKEVDPTLVSDRDYLVSMAESMERNEVNMSELARKNSEAVKAFLYLDLAGSDSVDIFSYGKEAKLKDLLQLHFQNPQNRN